MIRRERTDVDERRAWAHPLDVEGGGVLQRHALPERRERHVELQERCVSEHAERPFVGVQGRQTHSVADLLGRDHMALGRQALEELGRGELFPVRKRSRGQTAQDRAVVAENLCVGIAKGPRIELG